MKVHIGPYTRDLIQVTKWEQSYERWRMKGSFLETPEEWYDKLVFKFFDGLRNLVRPINRWSNTRPRKVVVKYDNYDTWNLDHTLALIILPGLKQLKATNHGFFHTAKGDVPQGLGETEEGYIHVMNELIWTFEQILEPKEFSSGNWDVTWKPVEGTKYSEMVEGPNHTFSVDTEAQKAYNDRINNGLRLFGKYYRNLWD